MTDFEKKIAIAIHDEYEADPDTHMAYYNKIGKIAAEIALQHIKEAFDANPCTDIYNMCGTITYEDLWENFQVRNGLK